MNSKTKVKNITDFLESIAPLSLQESYDNAGLIVGDGAMELTGLMLALDCTESVIDDALEKGCNMVVAHHPIVFGGLKKLNGKNYVERAVIKAIKNDVALYAIHTNLDNVPWGVNKKICDLIGLTNTDILAPKKQSLLKLTVFIPTEHAAGVLAALHEAGAGDLGRYESCAFETEGTGSFKPKKGANPHTGSIGVLEKVRETRAELILPAHAKGKVLYAMFAAHPYEEVAYYLETLENREQGAGAGMIGELPYWMTCDDFLARLQKTMDLEIIKHTACLPGRIHKVAVCGGAGSFLLKDAIARGADVFVSADFKYHEYFDAEGQIMIADIGHYESEHFTKQLLHGFLFEKFPNIAVLISKVNTNPVSYFI